MADQHGAPNEGHGPGAVQVDEQLPPNLQLAGWGLVIAIVFFGSAILVSSIVYPMIDHITNERFVQQGERSPAVRVQRESEEKRLSGYGYVDQQKGLVHIPVSEGMKKVIEEAKR
jgi:hypothetical protein